MISVLMEHLKKASGRSPLARARLTFSVAAGGEN